jgi:hypothetical protein
MTISISLSYAQSDGNSALKDPQKQVALVFDQDEFEGRFSVLFQSDENYDYYVIDLTWLKDRFERVYFMNLAYSESKLVSIDGDINKDQTWFKSYYTNKEADITCLLNELQEKTANAGMEMSPAEKSTWLSMNDKFIKK